MNRSGLGQLVAGAADTLRDMAGHLAYDRRAARALARTKVPASELRRCALRDRWRGLSGAIRLYRLSDDQLEAITRSPNVETAVVLHLYYPDTWPLFQGSLRHLDDDAFDLFVTLPEIHEAFANQVRADVEKARVLVVPNRGRDVLPFVRVATHLARLGYRNVLKLHSKKSTHRVGESDWLSGPVSKLIPADGHVMASLMATLRNPTTGIVGPKGLYVTLPVHFELNRAHILSVLADIYSGAASDNIMARTTRYGFFAGTMFWARLDAVEPVLRQGFPVSTFEPERGQLDTTFAHALERVLCLVPEIDRKQLYHMDGDGVEPITNHTANVPHWPDILASPTA